jgi:hypothetical protein
MTTSAIISLIAYRRIGGWNDLRRRRSSNNRQDFALPLIAATHPNRVSLSR